MEKVQLIFIGINIVFQKQVLTPSALSVIGRCHRTTTMFLPWPRGTRDVKIPPLLCASANTLTFAAIKENNYEQQNIYHDQA